MKLQDYKNKALKDPAFKKLYESYDLAFEMGQIVLEARLYAGVTQNELAELMGTRQPSIARLENGKSLPSLSFLSKVAKALGTYLIAPTFAFLNQIEAKSCTESKVENRLIPIEQPATLEAIRVNNVTSCSSKSFSETLTFSTA